VIVPFLGKSTVVRFSENLRNGSTRVEVGGSWVSGFIEVKYEGKWLVAVLSVTVLGRTYTDSVKLAYVEISGKPISSANCA
jgi:hypothetical protein